MEKKHKKGDLGQVFEDIILFHILPYLPIKSLFRFKCVCKKWLQWISNDPSFIRKQSQISLTSPGIVFLGHHRSLELVSRVGTPIDVPDPSLSFIKGFEGVFIEASCNGLLCFSIGQPNSTTMFVCNPVTMEWSLLAKTNRRGIVGLAFDPLGSPHTYKLALLYHIGDINDCMEFGFEVFSSETGVWMESRAQVVITKPQLFLPSSVFAGGILYWSLYGYIVWFDLQKDFAGVISPPGKDWWEHDNHALGVWGDKLTYTRIMVGKVVETWTMIEFKWTRIYQASLDSVIQKTNVVFRLLRRTNWKLSSLSYQGGDYLYFVLLVDRGAFGISSYNMKTGEVTKLKTRIKGWYHGPFFPYNNNFVRLPKLPNL